MSATSWFHAAIFFHYGMQKFYMLYPFYILICDVTYRRPFLMLSRFFLTEMSLMFTVRIKGEKRNGKFLFFIYKEGSVTCTKKVPFLSFSSQSPFFATAIWYDHVCLGFNVTAEKRRTPYRFLLPSVENFEKLNE